MKRKVILVGLTAKDTNLFHIIHIFVFKIKLLNKMWSRVEVKGIAYNIQCIVYIEHCICVCRMNTEYKIQYSVQCTVNSMEYTVYIKQYTPYINQCTVQYVHGSATSYSMWPLTPREGGERDTRENHASHCSVMHCYALLFSVLPLLCNVMHCSGLHYLSNVLLFTVLHFTTFLMYCYALYITLTPFWYIVNC